MTNHLPGYTEIAFAPATLGGLAISLQTDQGFFYVFGINRELAELDFHYSPDGSLVYGEINYTKGYEVDIYFGDGTYDRLKLHVQQTVRDLGLDEKARGLYAEWLKEHEVPERDPEEDRRRIERLNNISPETQKQLLALFGFDDDESDKTDEKD